MNAIAMKIMYLLMGSFLSVLAIKFKSINKKETLIPIFFGTMAYCFCFWGVSSIFHTSEGYPPQWFFWVTVTPPFISAILLVINISKE